MVSGPPPRHFATVFHVVAPSGHSFTCTSFEVESGLELRLVHGDDDVRRSELFSGDGRDERLADTADSWRLALLEIGFTEPTV
jgi:hypothetical protein